MSFFYLARKTTENTFLNQIYDFIIKKKLSSNQELTIYTLLHFSSNDKKAQQKREALEMYIRYELNLWFDGSTLLYK